MLIEMLIVIAAFGASLGLTRMMIAIAGRAGLEAVPNARSSHRTVTPTGGGVGFVVAGIGAGALLLGPTRPVETAIAVGAGAMLALVGLWDDLKDSPALLRLGVQGAVAVLVVGTSLGWSPALVLSGVGLVLAAIGFINIYNFMDGIDGLAGGEAVTVLLGAALLMAFGAGGGTAEFWFALALAAAVAGFLVFNRSPARIFMGDVGSTFLGLMLFYLALRSSAEGIMSLWQWLVLTAAFWCDGFATLGRRALRGEAIWRAHRQHAYQHLARRFGHGRVSLGYALVNIVGLLPIAAVIGLLPPLAPLLALGTLALGLAIAAALGAGSAE